MCGLLCGNRDGDAKGEQPRLMRLMRLILPLLISLQHEFS
jgi:hypothetical protein